MMAAGRGATVIGLRSRSAAEGAESAAVPTEVVRARKLALKHAESAVETIAAMAKGPASRGDQVRLAACRAILEIAIGANVTSTEDVSAQQLSDQDLRARVRRALFAELEGLPDAEVLSRVRGVLGAPDAGTS